jgi:hypothetical protein
MARVTIGGGNYRVGEVYLDMMFRQRALDNARAEMAQRASLERAKMAQQADMAERAAQQELIQMELQQAHQANMAREARDAAAQEAQLSRSYDMERRAEELGWDKEKLEKQIGVEDKRAELKHTRDLEAEARRFDMQIKLNEKSDELSNKRHKEDQRLSTLRWAADNEVYVPSEWIDDMETEELVNAVAPLIKERHGEKKLEEYHAAQANKGNYVEGMSPEHEAIAKSVKARSESERKQGMIDQLDILKATGGTAEQKEAATIQQELYKIDLEEMKLEQENTRIVKNALGEQMIHKDEDSIKAGRNALNALRERLKSRLTPTGRAPLAPVEKQNVEAMAPARSVGATPVAKRQQAYAAARMTRGWSPVKLERGLQAGPDTSDLSNFYAPAQAQAPDVKQWAPVKLEGGMPAGNIGGAWSQTAAENQATAQQAPEYLKENPEDAPYLLEMKRQALASLLSGR